MHGVSGMEVEVVDLNRIDFKMAFILEVQRDHQEQQEQRV